MFGSGSARLGSRMRIKFCNIKIGKVKSEKGFTLVELIFVTVITGTLSSTLILPFMSGIKQATRPEIYNTATYLAVEEIERKRSDGYSAVSGSIGTSTSSIDKVYSQATSAIRTYDYQVVTEYVRHLGNNFVAPDPADPLYPVTEFIKVTVTVSNTNIPHDVVLWEILAKDVYDPDAN